MPISYLFLILFSRKGKYYCQLDEKTKAQLFVQGSAED